jgi:hypothetical protein
MGKYLVGCALAGSMALTVGVAAQTPAPGTPTTQDPARAQGQAATVTVEGCLMREADIPGRRPNVAERAGIAEDYILTSTKMVKGSAPGRGTAEAAPGDRPTGTSGAQAGMFEVTGLDDERLMQSVGRRVQLDGTFANRDQARDRPEARTPADDLVEIRATAIRQVAGNCPATP